MEIVNASRGFTISTDAQMLDTAEGRRRGLMGQDRMDVVLAVPWESRILPMIHMFKMRYPIDVIWVNRRMEAVDVRSGIRPSALSQPGTWRMYAPKAPAKYVVEIGAGDIRNTGAGDKLLFR